LSIDKIVAALPPVPDHVPQIPVVDRKDLTDGPAAAVIKPAEVLPGQSGAGEEQRTASRALTTFPSPAVQLAPEILLP